MDLTPALCAHLFRTALGSAVSSSPYLKSNTASVEESDTLTLSHAEPRYCRKKLREKILLSRLSYIPNKAEPLQDSRILINCELCSKFVMNTMSFTGGRTEFSEHTKRSFSMPRTVYQHSKELSKNDTVHGESFLLC